MALNDKNGQDITLEQAKQKATYSQAGWYFNDDVILYEYTGCWKIDEGMSYPYLNVLSNSIVFNFTTVSGATNNQHGGNITRIQAKQKATYYNNGWNIVTISEYTSISPPPVVDWVINEGLEYPKFPWQIGISAIAYLCVKLANEILRIPIKRLEDPTNINTLLRVKLPSGVGIIELVDTTDQNASNVRVFLQGIIKAMKK